MSIFKGIFIRVHEGPNILEGYLLYISKSADLDLIKPHEAVLREKVDNISTKLKTKGMFKQPLLCFSDELSLPSNPCMQQKISYDKNGVEVVIFYSKKKSEVLIKEPFYLADGHHRLAAMTQTQVVSLVGKAPIFLASTKSIKVEPFVHHQNLNNHNLSMLNKKYSRKNLISNGAYLSKLYLNGVIKDVYFNHIDEVIDLERSVFDNKLPIEYLNYSSFQQLVATGDLDLMHKVCLQYPSIGKREICELSEKGILLPEHSTYFYPKLPDNILDLVMFD